jgi:hypothetical protein
MALVNPNIAMSYRPTTEYQPRNALADYAQIQQIVGAQEQQQLNALKMQEARAAMEERNALRQLNPTAPDYEAQLFKVSPQLGIQYRKEAAATAAQKAAQEKSAFDLKAAQRSFMDKVKLDLSSNPSDENVKAFGQDAVIQGIYPPEVAEREVAQLLAMPPEQRAQLLRQSGATAAERKPTVTSRTRGDIAEILLTDPLTGKTTVSAGSAAAVPLTQAQQLQDERERERIRQEGQRLGLEGRRAMVLEENQRRDADPAFQRRMAGAKAVGEAIAKGDVAAQQALPKIVNRAEEGLLLIDEMVGKQEVRDKNGKVIQPATKPHPGFQGAVGATWLPGARFVPGTDAADFMSRFDQIKGASFLEAFESLKGGGAITETEGTKATSAINRMSTAQSEKEFMAAARDLQEVVRKGVVNAQRKAGGAVPAGAASTAPNIDALLEKYK